METPTARPQSVPPSLAIAQAFVAARRAGRGLPEFPGHIPTTLDAGYSIQEAAIGLWDDDIIGWKVGKIPDELVGRLGQSRVTGPIFREGLLERRSARGQSGAGVRRRVRRPGGRVRVRAAAGRAG